MVQLVALFPVIVHVDAVSDNSVCDLPNVRPAQTHLRRHELDLFPCVSNLFRPTANLVQRDGDVFRPERGLVACYP